MEMKTFPYAVIWNGEFVAANTPIPIETEEEKTADEKPKKGTGKKK